MMFFKNMKIGTKLMVFMLILEFLIAGIAYYGISVVKENDATYETIMADDVMTSCMLLGLNAQDPAKTQMFTAAMEKDLNQAEENMKKLQESAYTDAAKAGVANITNNYNTFRQETVAALKAKQAGQVQSPEAQAASSAKFAKLEGDIVNQLEELADMGYSSAQSRDKAATEEMNSDVRNIILITLFLLVVSSAAGFLFNQDVKKRLGQLGQSADRIAEGDLATEVVTSTGDELGDVAASFEIMRQRVHKVLLEINQGADQVAAGAHNVSDASVALSQGASQQAASVEQLSASIAEIASQTASNAQNAEKANDLTVGTKEKAQLGNEEMQEMLSAMEEINASSANISKIIKVIDEIAFQTNILALNAAVEAARAGQHGKGFAVVAEEVRNLAARSAKAAKETTDMIEGSMAKVETGREIAHKTAEALNAIVGDVSSVADIVANIAKASNEQKLALEQINQGVQQVSQVVQANSSTSEEAATASQNLNQQADIMRANVGKFRLSNSGGSFYGGKGGSAIQKPDLSSAGRQPAVVPAKPGVKPRNIALTDDEGFGKY